MRKVRIRRDDHRRRHQRAAERAKYHAALEGLQAAEAMLDLNYSTDDEEPFVEDEIEFFDFDYEWLWLEESR